MVNRLLVGASSPDTEDGTYSGSNHQQLGAVDGPKLAVHDKPDWLDPSSWGGGG